MSTPYANAVERRFLNSDRARPRLQTRGEGDDAKRMIVGYAVVYYDPTNRDTEYELWPGVRERMIRGCCDAAIAEDDVRALANHKVGWLLGRNTSGTLRLKSDDFGLAYEIDVPDTQAGRDTVVSLERGDMDGSSFGFDLNGKRGRIDRIEETVDGETVVIYEVRDLELFDVGPVTFPAYKASSAGVRSADAAAKLQQRYEALLARDNQPSDDDAFDVDLEADLAAYALKLRD